MNFRNLFVGALAVLSLAACSKTSNDALTPPPAGGGAALVDEGQSYVRGTPAYAFSVEHGTILIDGAAVDSTDGAFEGYPMLASNVAELKSVTKAVETREQNIELWNGEELLLAADLRADNQAIVFSKSGMSVEKFTYTRMAADQGQGLSHGTINVELRECLVPKEEDKGQDQDQDKGQDQSKGEEPVKGEDQGQDQSKGENQAKGEDKGQEQDQEKGEEVKAPTCKIVSYTMNLSEIEAPKEQDQGKGQDQDKGQDQSKGEEPSKGQDQDKGQDQSKGQDQAKGEEPVKGEDQAKGEEPVKGEEPSKGQDQDQSKGEDQAKGQDQSKGQDQGAHI